MSKRAKIKSVEPKNGQSGVHETYVMHEKTYWKFIVEMDNGDKGIASALSDKFRFNLGDDVFYEHVSDEAHGDRLKSFTAVDQPQRSQQSYTPTQGAPQQQKKYQEDPDKAARIVAQSSISSAIEWVKLQPVEKHTSEYLFQVAAGMEKWVHDSIERTKKA